MPLDPQMKNLLDTMAAAEVPAFHTLTPEEARQMTARRVVQGAAVEAVANVEDRTIPGPGGDARFAYTRRKAPARLARWSIFMAADGWSAIST